MGFQFFSESDMRRDPKTGELKIVSEFPMWYNPRLIQEMEENVAMKEAALASGQVEDGVKGEYIENLARAKEQLKKMQDMTLVDDAKNDRASLGKAAKEIGKALSDLMPKQALCDRRLVDTNREYRNLSEPTVKIENELQADLARACNVPITNGKITGYGAQKMWKIATKFLGDYANVETLRKQ